MGGILIYIGTSGIVLPGNKETFPEEFRSGTRLQYYSSIFNSLEINSSFYKTPKPQTFSKWKEEVHNDFRFTVKMSGAITHSKKLDYNPEDLNYFMNSINHLEQKEGALLIQFPASITFDYLSKVEKIIKEARFLQANSQWDIAVELRHSSWYNSVAYNMLIKYGTSMVFHDMPASKTPLKQPATDIIYLRFHGPLRDYKGSYNDSVIKDWAQWINDWHKAGKTIYVYFNNTIGNAYNNALMLKHYCSTDQA